MGTRNTNGGQRPFDRQRRVAISSRIASWPARCNRRTESRPPASARARPCPMARPTMAASASGLLKRAALPNSNCSPAVTLKTPPLPFTSARFCFAAAIRHVLAEHHYARIAAHLLMQRGIHPIHHGFGSPLNCGSASKVRRVGIDLVGIQIVQRRIPRRGIRVQHVIGGSCTSDRLRVDALQRMWSSTPSSSRNWGKRMSGSRARSASRSAAVL